MIWIEGERTGQVTKTVNPLKFYRTGKGDGRGGGFSVRSNFKGCHVFVTLAYTYAFKKFFFRYFFASTDIYNLRIRILMNGITLEKLDPDLLEACLSVVYYAIS